MRSELKLKTIRSFDNDVKRLKKKHYDISRLEGHFGLWGKVIPMF